MSLNSFPKELILHVLTFLPGDDVERFQQLNTLYKKLIIKNRDNLARPIFEVFISHKTYREDTLDVYIGHAIHSWSYKIPLQEEQPPVEVPEVEEVAEETKRFRQFCRKRFTKFTKRWRKNSNRSTRDNYEEQIKEVKETVPEYNDLFYNFKSPDSLKEKIPALFEFVLKKGDVDYFSVNEDFRPAFKKAIINTSARIRKVEMDSRSIDYNLLKIIGSQKHTNKTYPTMQIDFKREKEDNYWHKVKTVNEIASAYKFTLLKFKDIDEAVLKITDIWRTEGFPEINFALDVSSAWFCEKWKEPKNLLTSGFEISFENKRQTLIFKDLQNGNVLKFNKIFTIKGYHERHDNPFYLYVTITCHKKYNKRL